MGTEGWMDGRGGAGRQRRGGRDGSGEEGRRWRDGRDRRCNGRHERGGRAEVASIERRHAKLSSSLGSDLNSGLLRSSSTAVAPTDPCRQG
jgi:hypothetical protein